MAKHYSTQEMIEDCKELVDTPVVTEWEDKFLKSIIGRVTQGTDLTEKQYEILERIHIATCR